MLIAGEPGIGKSTFMSKFAQDILKKELFKADYVFFVRFREINYKDKTDLLSVLATGAKFIATLQSKERKIVLENLQNCNDVYILMDGLDEAILNSEMQGNKCDEFSITTAEIFIKRLLSGDILPQAKKIVTSRPHQLASLTDVVNNYNFVVNILGLNDDGQRQICDEICRNTNENRRDKILDFLNSRPDLKSYCYVPVNCILIMMSFNEMKELEWKKVYSFTSIFLTALKEWFLIRLKNQFQLWNISKLAYDGFLENRLYFKQYHLAEAEINSQTISTFLAKHVSFKLLQGNTVSYFCHLTWQELFTAVMLRLYSSKEQFSNFITTLDTDRYEVVTKFLFGLCNEDKLEDFRDLVNDRSRLNSFKDRTESKKMLKSMAVQKLQGLKDTSSLLQVLGWIYEMHDKSFTRHASQCLVNKITITGEILPSDIPCLNYVLQFRETGLILDVDGPSFVGNSFQFFIKYLSNTLLEKKHIQVCRSITVYSTMRALLWGGAHELCYPNLEIMHLKSKVDFFCNIS